MNKKVIIEYLHTVIIALIVALFLAGIATGCSKIIAEHHVRMISKMANTAKDNEMISYLISIYKDKAVENPGDYSINVKLGNLYELMLDFKEAESQYKIAIAKSPYGVYSSYFGLANLYVKQKKYKDALNLVKKIKNTDHKPLLVAKGDFYTNLGDALWQSGQFEEAVKQYKVAFFFYKKVDSKKREGVVNGILDCYNKIADKHFKNRRVDKAIQSLETALLYKETPILMYKLAILYKGFDPITANEYMEKTYKIDPGLINFDIYEEILYSLIRMYYEQGKEIETDLYKHKLRAVKNFQKRYVIDENDVKIDIKKLKLKKNLLGTKYVLHAKFNIQNASKYDFNKLFIVVKLRYDNDTKILLEEKLYSKNEPLKARNISDDYEIKFEYTDKDVFFAAEEMFLDFYAGKKENIRKIPVYSVKIEQ